MITWLLILHLQSGGVRVELMPDLQTCVAASQLRMRLDDTIHITECIPARNTQA